jgi:hypothetical protein
MISAFSNFFHNLLILDPFGKMIAYVFKYFFKKAFFLKYIKLIFFNIFLIILKHYQKIDKYKRKYRGKKIKTKQKKKWWRAIFTNGITDGINSVGKFVGKLWTLFIMSITKGITDGQFRRHFPESSRTVHFPIALLIVVLYG